MGPNLAWPVEFALSLAPLSIDERVLHFLTGLDFIDPALGVAVPIIDRRDLLPSLQAHASAIARVWERAEQSVPTPLVELNGPLSEVIVCAAAAAEQTGLRIATVSSGAIPQEANERARFARLCERELLLADVVLLVECEAGDADRMEAMRSFANEYSVPLVFAWEAPSPLEHRCPVVRYEIHKPPSGQQRQLWRTLLPIDEMEGLDEVVDAIVAQFDLAPALIRSSADLAARTIDRTSADATEFGSALWYACRHQSRMGIDELATRLDPRADWDDLVLPEKQTALLRALCYQVQHRTLVYDDWGFAAGLSRGLGITALFAGTSGTGKTMAAEVIANELNLDLFVIDLSTIMSKYIGETEKHLRRVFDAAERSGAILLFDEADSLFGKRSQIKDSHDRYANTGGSYLLTRIESYRGVAILTTDRKDVVDEAFMRRLRFVVEFGFPDQAQREILFRRAFPKAAPTGKLDFVQLSELDVSGVSIRNITLGAAFAAAEECTLIEMRHVEAASRAEFAKSGRTITIDWSDE